MSNSSVQPRSNFVEEFLSSDNLGRADATVTEIFAMMFGFEIRAIDSQAHDLSLVPQLEERTAVVGFSGVMRGSCQICVNTLAAKAIASAMLGGAPVEEEDSINDALGELCNMLAGGWKNATPSLSSECILSPPTVISGQHYKVHVRKPSAKLSRAYEFDSYTLNLTLHCEDLDTSQE